MADPGFDKEVRLSKIRTTKLLTALKSVRG